MTAINSNRAIRGPVTAVPVVAGKGVRLTADTENNRWVVEADETVLWSGSEKTTSASITLSEPIENFERFAVYGIRANESLDRAYQIREFGVNNGVPNYAYPNFINIESSTLTVDYMYLSLSGTTVSIMAGCRQNGSTFSNNITSYNFNLVKIVGVNRIASN